MVLADMYALSHGFKLKGIISTNYLLESVPIIMMSMNSL